MGVGPGVVRALAVGVAVGAAPGVAATVVPVEDVVADRELASPVHAAVRSAAHTSVAPSGFHRVVITWSSRQSVTYAARSRRQADVRHYASMARCQPRWSSAASE